MKYGERVRRPYSAVNPYMRLAQSLAPEQRQRIAARYAEGEDAEDIAKSENVLLGAVRLIGESVKVVANTALAPDRLHRIRVLLCGHSPARVAAMEGLPLEVVEKIAERSERQERRRAARAAENTAGTNGG